MSTSTTDPKKILRELVALPSVHPEADAVGTVPGEAAMAGWMADHLRTLGAAVKISLIAPGRPSVVGVFEEWGTSLASLDRAAAPIWRQRIRSGIRSRIFCGRAAANASARC